MDRAIYQFDYDHETGAISDKRLFASTMSDPGNPDGSTVDAEAFLWNAQWDGWQLVQYAPDGSVDRVSISPCRSPRVACSAGRAFAPSI
jgi:sugar lactone lactonase YvrE